MCVCVCVCVDNYIKTRQHCASCGKQPILGQSVKTHSDSVLHLMTHSVIDQNKGTAEEESQSIYLIIG